jgi:hypothetical protein
MKMKLEIKINIRQNILLGLVFLATMLFSCTVTQEINGFGGGNRTFTTKINNKPTSNQQEVNQTLNTSTVTDAINSKSELRPAVVPGTIQQELTPSVTENQIKENLKQLKPMSKLKSKIITKLLETKLKHQKSKNKSLFNKSDSIFPDRNSDFLYYLLFILFSFFFIGGIIFILAGTGLDKYSGALSIAFGILLLIASGIQYLGLINYDKLDECGFLYQFGYWTSMVAGILVIPLFIWLIGALTCGS